MASASPRDQSTSPPAISSARCANWRTSFGWRVNPSGTLRASCSRRSRVASGTPVLTVGSAGLSCSGWGSRAGGWRGLGPYVVQGRLEPVVELVQRLLGLLQGDVAPPHQCFGVELAHGPLRLDPLVHERLGVARVVALVVPVAAVADEVDHHVLVEGLPEPEGQPGGPQAGLGVVAVDVEDRRLDHLGHVGRVDRACGRPQGRW